MLTPRLPDGRAGLPEPGHPLGRAAHMSAGLLVYLPGMVLAMTRNGLTVSL